LDGLPEALRDKFANDIIFFAIANHAERWSRNMAVSEMGVAPHE